MGLAVAAIITAIGVYAGVAAGLSNAPSQSQVGWALLAAVAAGVLAYRGAAVGGDALRAKGRGGAVVKRRGPTRLTVRQSERNRRLMLARVRSAWIQGVLDQSLETIARIELGLQRRSDALRPCAGLVTHRGPTAEIVPCTGQVDRCSVRRVGRSAAHPRRPRVG